jgi:hypothetical protein
MAAREEVVVDKAFDGSKSAALVDLSPGKWMRLPPTVHLTLYESAVCSL